jgi:hypothetical protein
VWRLTAGGMTGGWGIAGLWMFFNLTQSPNVETVDYNKITDNQFEF